MHIHKNIADLMTKHLKAEGRGRLMAEMGLSITFGRAESSLALSRATEAASNKLTIGQLWKLWKARPVCDSMYVDLAARLSGKSLAEGGSNGNLA